MIKLVDKLYGYENALNILDSIDQIVYWDSLRIPKAALNSSIDQKTYINRLKNSIFNNSSYKKLLYKLNRHNLSHRENTIVSYRLSELKHHELYSSIEDDWIAVTVNSTEAFKKAKERYDFRIWQPALEKLINTAKEYGKLSNQDTYAVFLDDYEHANLDTNELTRLFDYLKPRLQELIGTIKEAKNTKQLPISDIWSIDYTPEIHEKIKKALIYHFDLDQDRILIDSSLNTHPFQLSVSYNDKRMMDFPKYGLKGSIYTLIHEMGHLMYELGIDESLDNTCLNGTPTMSLHESQSKLWEDNIGTSKEFLRFLLFYLKKYIPNLKVNSFEQLYRAFNDVSEDPIRLKSDELHYCMHIIIRFELERELLSGDLKVENLSKEWNLRYKKYLEVEPNNDGEGILQDSHWSDGSFGYFPSYALGVIYASMFWEKLNQDNTNAQYEIANGKFKNIQDWLKNNIHQHGALYSTPEILEKACNKGIDADCYLNYLKTKYYNLYEL